MKAELPQWALEAATSDDLDRAREAQHLGTMRLLWPELEALRAWAKGRGWPRPWLSFQAAFVAKMLESRENFAAALAESGIAVHLPKRDHALSAAELAGLDAMYEPSLASGRPRAWGLLVEALREIRRAVEAGVVVRIEGGPDLSTWQGFYDWAHKRFYKLEEGSDAWIGDDS